MEIDQLNTKLDEIKKRMESIIATGDPIEAKKALVELLVLVTTVEQVLVGLRKDIEKALIGET